MKVHIASLLAVYTIGNASAFSPLYSNTFSSSSTSLYADRRAFLNTAAVTIIGGSVSVGPVFADDSAVDDLAMPTPEEQKAQDVSFLKVWLKYHSDFIIHKEEIFQNSVKYVKSTSLWIWSLLFL